MVEALLKRSLRPFAGTILLNPIFSSHRVSVAMLGQRKVPCEYHKAQTFWSFLDLTTSKPNTSFCFGRAVSNSLRELSALWSTPSTAFLQLRLHTYPHQWPPPAKWCLLLDATRRTGSLNQCIVGLCQSFWCPWMPKTTPCAHLTPSTASGWAAGRVYYTPPQRTMQNKWWTSLVFFCK